MAANCLYCYIPGATGIASGQKLASLLQTNPWHSPHGTPVGTCRLFVPDGLAQDLPMPECGFFCISPRLAQEARQSFHKVAGHIFIGACGIAVRAIAPCLLHKSADPPVVVIDPPGLHVISLLSGHWGGGNRLALHLARLLGARPVITTQSESCGEMALDLFLQAHDMQILDWHCLPRAQAEIAKGRALPLHDPFRFLPACQFLKIYENDESPLKAAMPHVAVCFRQSAPMPGTLRVVPRLFHLGIGFRRHVDGAQLAEGLQEFLDFHKLEASAIRAIATVSGKGKTLQALADQIQARLLEFPAHLLAKTPVPHPSAACGARFSQKPFSVCEGAALLSASTCAKNASLVAEKFVWRGLATFALAVPCDNELAARIRSCLK